ncbi:MAG: response regulator, partial [Planctomycetes bacterium]|nr:response regulator [Planctomycetota bacterium]
MRILLVDDNEATLEALAELVEMTGHEASCCTTGQAALRLCAERDFPMVITDIKMPGMDGLELLDRLNEMPSMVGSDIVLCTGHGSMELAIRALRKGAYDFINKPVDPEEMKALIG